MRKLQRFAAVFFLVVAGISFSALQAKAIAISKDDPVFGLGSITLSVGYEWLDLNLTTGISAKDMMDQMATGGRFDGFRHANFYEIYALFVANGMIDPNFSFPEEEYTAPAQALISIMGATDVISGQPAMFGYREVHMCTDGELHTYAVALSPGLTHDGKLGYRASLDLDGGAGHVSYEYASGNVGNFIVRPYTSAPVPEPTTILIGSVIAFFGFKKNKKS